MLDPQPILASARRLQTIMSASLMLLTGATLALAILGISDPDRAGQALARLANFPVGEMAGWQNWGLMMVILVHLLVWGVLLTLARGLFGQLALGNPAGASGIARKLAYWLWFMLVWGVISQVIVSAVATWGFPAGQRMISIALGTPQLSVAFSALIASFMARAFALGADLWQDHQEVV
jgi:hypothetical protein